MQLARMLLNRIHKPITATVFKEPKGFEMQPVTIKVDKLFPQLGDHFNHQIKALKTKMDDCDWYIIPQDEQPFCLVKVEQVCEEYESTQVEVFTDFSSCTPEYADLAKLYYFAALNLCLRSKLISEAGKQTMLAFTNKLDSHYKNMSSNFYESNALIMTTLLCQHRCFDFEWTLKLPNCRK